jgi:hypothetical protein
VIHPTAFARRTLMIKAPEVHRPGWLRVMADYFLLPNEFLLGKNMVPYQAGNAAYMQITLFSTITPEARIRRSQLI